MSTKDQRTINMVHHPLGDAADPRNLQTYLDGIDAGIDSLAVEGSWTPVLRFGGATTGITYTAQVGRYIRVGNLVTVWGSIQVNSNGTATGDATVANLPFTSSNVSGIAYVGPALPTDLEGGVAGGVYAVVDPNSTIVSFRQSAEGGGDGLDQTHIVDGAALDFTVTYRTG